MTKNFLYGLVWLVLNVGSRALGSPIQITFENLKEHLEKKNAKVGATRLELEASKEREGFLARSFLPSLELYGSQENFKQGPQDQKAQPTYGAEMKINLFNGGRDQLESQVRDLNSNKNEIQLARVLSEELQKARTLFWEIIYTQDHIQLMESTLQINQQNLASAERRIRSGVATESDRFEFEMKASDLKRELEQAQLKVANQKRDLAVVLNKDPTVDLRLPQDLVHSHDFEELLKHSPQDHDFLFKENELRARTARLNSQIQNRLAWPRVEAFAAYNQFNQREKDFGSSSDRAETVFGIRMSISLLSGLESRREASALALESQASQSLAEYQKREIETHVEIELSELRFQHAQVHESEKNIERAEKYYKLTQSEYARGVKNSPDMLGATEKLFEMKHKRLELIRDFQISKTHLLAKIGK